VAVGAGFRLHIQRVDNSVLGRLVTVEDVANGVAFLAGPDSSFITGESLMISVS
jgi:NAD(P)-dependent dehydrogenase (short-subunit alcohol dehydrogenase family)